ncbi:MAG: glycosyltransferase family 2 protein [Flavobacteriaceae bacterium]|nr:glycosyltransferase family 2 protein [Flavobacteriaceae bacterium]
MLSIIIPVLNEASCIAGLIEHLSETRSTDWVSEIIVVDGGSTDGTLKLLETLPVSVVPSKKGRARQMNAGAKAAKGDTLYFLHADTLPPKDFDIKIREAIAAGFETGCFRMRFDTQNVFLRFFGWMTRINHTLCRGGDQSLFIKKEVFFEEGGFNEAYMIYEDTEFITRLYRRGHFRILPDHVITSARKYREKGSFNVQFHFAVIHLKNFLGASPEALYAYYQKKILA